MLLLKAKLTGKNWQYELLFQATHTANFIRNKSVRYWMDRHRISKNDRQKLCAFLAKEFEWEGKLNSQARQASKAVGIDLGLQCFYTDSEGNQENPRFFRKSDKFLKSKCPDCGLIKYRDLNAAKNILARGLGLKSTVSHTETLMLAETHSLACIEKSTRVKVSSRTKNPTHQWMGVSIT